MSNNKIIDELKPISATSDKDYFITLHSQSRTIFISADLADKLGIISGDRIGFSIHPDNLGLNFMYVTSNPVGTVEVKKYRNAPYRIHDLNTIKLLSKRFSYPLVGSFRINVDINLFVKKTQNGVTETLYYIYDNVDQRTDIDELTKSLYKARFADAIKSLK